MWCSGRWHWPARLSSHAVCARAALPPRPLQPPLRITPNRWSLPLLAVLVLLLLLARIPGATAQHGACGAPDARAAQVERFQTWFSNGPGSTHGIALRAVEEGTSDDTTCHAESAAVATNWSAPASTLRPFGVFALKPVRQEQKILSVALKWIVCRRTALLSGGRALRSAVRSLRGEEEVLLLLILHERALGNASRWHPYFAMLPGVDEVVAPIGFDNASLAMLQSPVFEAEARAKIEQLLARRARLAPLLKTTLLSESATKTKSKSKAKRGGAKSKRRGDAADAMLQDRAAAVQRIEVWMWARHILDSRALSFRGERLLIPLVDFFRYKPVATPDAAVGSDWEAYHRLERNVFTMHADRAFAAGEELREDYGCMQTVQYFRNGFVPLHNPCDCARVRRTPLLRALREPAKGKDADHPRLAALRDLATAAALSLAPEEITNNENAEYELTCIVPEAFKPNAVPNAILALLALDGMTLADAVACLADISAQRPASKAACALVIATGESENPPASAGGIATGRILAAGRLLELLRSQLMEYELQSTVAEDECMLRNPVARLRLRPNDVLAVQFRISQKRVLARAINVIAILIGAATPAAPHFAASRATAASWCAANDFNNWFSKKFAFAQEHFFRRGIEANVFDDAKHLIVHAAPTSLGSNSFGLYAIRRRGVGTGEPYLCVPMNFAISVKQSNAAMSRSVVGLQSSSSNELVMDRASAQSCTVLGPLFRKMQRLYKRSDAMHELLLHLMFERFGRQNESAWWPYLRVLPAAPPAARKVSDNASSSDSPPQTHAAVAGGMGWGDRLDVTTAPLLDACAVARLGALSPGTSRILQQYRRSVDRAFRGIEGAVFALNRDVFPAHLFTVGRYRWARAILEARSFWWDGARHLVPMLDFVNSDNGASSNGRVHSTRPDRTRHFAVSNALRPFSAGAEIVTSYGLPNFELLLKHGFILSGNEHDCFVLDCDVRAASGSLASCAALTLGRNGAEVAETCRSEWEVAAALRMQRAAADGYTPALQYCVQPNRTAVWEPAQHVDILFGLGGDSSAAIAQLLRMCEHQLERFEAARRKQKQKQELNRRAADETTLVEPTDVGCSDGGSVACDIVDEYATEQQELLTRVIAMISALHEERESDDDL